MTNYTDRAAPPGLRAGIKFSRAVVMDAMARAWVTAYQAGHHDTVEACYTDPEPDGETLTEHLQDAVNAALAAEEVSDE